MELNESAKKYAYLKYIKISKLEAILNPRRTLAFNSFFELYIAFPKKKSSTVENNNMEKKNPLVLK
jgi:hypothetical protein